jgi:hypothetical protein
MSKPMIVILALCLLPGAGCHSDRHQQQTAMQDACTHCPGDQTMTAKGTCEKCGMKVDCCAACDGMQVMTADGRCPDCDATVAQR